MSFYTYRKTGTMYNAESPNSKPWILQCKNYKRAEIAFNYHGQLAWDQRGG